MDYEGKYFPDEEDERTPKAAKRTKKTLHRIFYAAVAAVYVVVFAVLLNNCEPKLYKKYTFSPEANELYRADPEAFEVYKLFPPVFMSYDGAVQIAAAAYSPTASELEIGIKYNSSVKGKKDGAPPQFALKDTEGRVYTLCNTVSGKKGRYRYLRLSFAGVRLELDDNVYINPEASAAAEGEGKMYDTFNYFLEIRRPNGEKPETIVIYNRVTPIQLTKFR